MAFIIGTSTSNTQILAAGTTAERPATPSAGQLRYNSTDLAFETYSGTSWSQFGQGYGSYTTTGLFIHYDFSNPSCYSGSGTAVIDLMGTQGGTITGATFGGSNLAKYLSFTGNGTTYVQMGSSIPASQSTSGFTLEAWIYTTAMSGTNTTDGIGAIISSQNDTGTRGASINTDTRSAHGGGPNGYHPQVGTGSTWATTGSAYNTGSGTAAVSNRWDHIAYTWSNGNPLRVYENGSLLAANTTNFSGTVNWSNTYWALGRQLSNSGYPRAYTGYIAIARIYNNALSAGDVLYNYNGQKSRFGL